MNPTSAIVLTGSIVVANKWITHKPVNIRLVVGLTGAALGMAIINESNAKLAGTFSTLIVVTAALMYVPGIWQSVNSTGMVGKQSNKLKPGPPTAGAGGTRKPIP